MNNASIAEPVATEHEAFTKAAAQWRHWGANDPQGNMTIAENAARELEIQRDTGKIVHLNKRC